MKKAILFLVMLFATMVTTAQYRTGKCIEIIDGDTYKFVTGKDTLKIRDAYCNTPEPKNTVCSTPQPGSKEASLEAARILLGKEFRIKIIGKDYWHRTLAYAIMPEGGFYHRYMIRNGFAWSYFPEGLSYRLQLQAQKNKVGIWASPEEPINPSFWLKTYNTHKK